MEVCPSCGVITEKLVTPDAQMIFSLQSSNLDIPTKSCFSCMIKLREAIVLKGRAKFLAESRNKDEHKKKLWKSRIRLIKTGRTLMNYKKYADAAQAYEKYLRIVEIIFDLEKGKQISPDLFKESARTTELTIITSVYWDLLRIYDTQYKFNERQIQVSNQLAKFAVVTPIFPDILRKAHAFVRKANNPAAIKMFIKSASKTSKCFIATSAFASPFAPEVIQFRLYRDRRLKKFFVGRIFILLYYLFSPTIAALMELLPVSKPLIRALLKKICQLLT